MDLRGLQVTWLGHGTFKLRTPDGKSVLIDPWVQNNPACPDDQKQLGALDTMLVTHAHFDHIADAVTVAQDSHPEHVVAIFELGNWLQGKGIENVVSINKGGTLDLGEFRATMVHADHSCGISDGDQILYGGEAAGYVLRFQSGLSLYVAGDTNVFGDMRIIGELYHPQVAILPIGDFYTMGPMEACYATGLLGVQAVIPAHFGTFPALTGRPSALRAELERVGLGRVEVAEMQPGQTLS